MYGKRCVSVCDVALADLVEACEDVEEAAFLVRGVKNDGMGVGFVLYWPSVA